LLAALGEDDLMAQVRVGLTCGAGHFNPIGALWEPVKDKDIDKLAERARIPTHCEYTELGALESIGPCVATLAGLPHVEGREREANRLARVGGRNIPAGLSSSSKGRPNEGPLTPAEWARLTYERQRETPRGPSLCAVTREPLSFRHDHCHHPLEKRLLRARGLHAHVWDERNAIFVKASIHEGHTSKMQPIPREALPASVWEFAREIGPWATARVEADHPLKEE
jgi:hypothetical protein